MQSANITTLRVPPTFFEDHLDRCPIEGKIVKSTKTYVKVELSDYDISDLISDAEHYSDPSIAREMGMPGLASSARSTMKSLERQLGERLESIRAEQRAIAIAERKALLDSPEYKAAIEQQEAEQQKRAQWDWEHPRYNDSSSLLGWSFTNGEREVRVLGVESSYSWVDGHSIRWTVSNDEVLELELPRLSDSYHDVPRVGQHGSWRRVAT